ncbi:MAG: TIGR02266 family protein [Deltaproteobacteria bacterium]|nr:TIGR02266 family protein [Deltaproteobacteria bacterium]
MAEEKRNYPRAKVLSMTVRYKSATVDDFVEHHSDNVSRGGIFIKTGSPFPAGTLLKFEIRIADEQAVLAGVGRVVWRRTDTKGDERPAGMGVKFIKLDEKSRALISRLVDAHGGGSTKYDAGLPEGEPADVGKKTPLGLGEIGVPEAAPAAAGAKAPEERPSRRRRCPRPRTGQ